MIKKMCGLCGARFDNVFEAVDHTRKSGSEQYFDPKYILGVKERMAMGTLFTQIHNLSWDKSVRDKVEKAFSLLYIAEMRPNSFPYIYKAFIKAEVEGYEFDITSFVYMIVTQEALKEVGLR